MVKEFQKQVETKISEYLKQELILLETNDPIKYKHIYDEYDRQFNVISSNIFNSHRTNLADYNHNDVLISCLSEPVTNYKLDDLTNNMSDNDLIYSPRIDIAISPVILKKRGKKVSIGNFRMTNDVSLFEEIHTLDFITNIESLLRQKSNENFQQNRLSLPQFSEIYNDSDYINKRPLHLFGIEIENQKNPKHLMGDFLNAISLSKIPIVITPEYNFEILIKMLLFSTTIKNLKEVPIYNILNRVIILKVDQFRNIVNQTLAERSIDPIDVQEYR